MMRVIGHGSVASILSVILGFIRFIAAIGLFVAFVGLCALPFVPTPNVTVTVPVSFRLDNPSISGRDGFGFQIQQATEAAKPEQHRQVESVAGALRIPSASKQFIAVNAVALIAVLIFTLFILDQVRAVLRTLIHGNPFDARNATHIRRIGLAVIVAEIARTAIVYAENYYAMTHVAIAGLQFDALPRVSFTTIGCGLIILIIAEVFGAGTRLDEEQQFTI